MATYTKQMQQIVEEYREAGMEWPVTAKTMAAWALETGRWVLPRSAAIQRCAEDLAKAMREEYFTDAKGRRVRAKHPVRLEPEQPPLWDDFHTMPRDHAHLSFQQRRQQIVGDCRQLKTDQDSYNDIHPDYEPINLVFDFTMDLAELEAAAD